MGKRSQRVAESRQNIAARGRRLWEAQHNKPKGKGKGWDDVLGRQQQRKGKTVMMMSTTDRMPFGIELDTSQAGVKRRLWSDA